MSEKKRQAILLRNVEITTVALLSEGFGARIAESPALLPAFSTAPLLCRHAFALYAHGCAENEMRVENACAAKYYTNRSRGASVHRIPDFAAWLTAPPGNLFPREDDRPQRRRI
uniref:Uncharacterized protein n=1 Tax=Paracidobacterium acidisoli TaxID=2303751 RepID=A0A372IKK5_9BACT